jgi:hypothetical protein
MQTSIGCSPRRPLEACAAMRKSRHRVEISNGSLETHATHSHLGARAKMNPRWLRRGYRLGPNLRFFRCEGKKPGKTAIAEATSGNGSTIIVVSGLVKCLARTRQSNTDPNVADVAAMFSTIPITEDRIGGRDCTGGGFLIFGFCFFVAIADPVSGPLT